MKSPSDQAKVVSFNDISKLIKGTRQQLFQAVDILLIRLFCKISKKTSLKLFYGKWAEGFVDQGTHQIARTHPRFHGFIYPNFLRVKHFYEALHGDAYVSMLLTQFIWTHHLIILSLSKLPERRDHYLCQPIKEKWSSRELEKQLKTALIEPLVLNQPKVSPEVAQTYPTGMPLFKDAYMVEFLGLPDGHTEADRQTGLLNQLKSFQIELGRFLLCRLRFFAPG